MKRSAFGVVATANGRVHVYIHRTHGPFAYVSLAREKDGPVRPIGTTRRLIGAVQVRVHRAHVKQLGLGAALTLEEDTE